MILVFSLLFFITLVCGIGLERALIFSRIKFDFWFYGKNFCLAILTSSPVYFLQKYFFSLIDILFFVPFVLIGFILFANLLVSKIFEEKSLAKKEMNFLIGISLFALFEASSFVGLLLIIVVGFLSLLICELLLKAFMQLIAKRNANYYLKLGSLSLVMLGMITLVIAAINVFYMNFLF